MAGTTHGKRPRTRGALSAPFVTVLFSPDARWRGKRLPVAGALRFGREGDGGALVLADPAMSRLHGSFASGASKGEVVVEDLGSRNGVARNGMAVDARASLAPGDIVRAGDTIFLFALGNANATEASAEAAPTRILGDDEALRAALARVRLVAKRDTAVLILGETGTGKDLVAREIHDLSGRLEGRFVAVNCAAVPLALFESAFFGHRKGAFSGATDAQAGYFEAADGGTLFLDEVGEIPIEAQAKLLRAIETKEVTAVGSTTPRTVSTRIVAATNRDLRHAAATGGFRPDLLARLSAWTIEIPPLRARRGDILPLFAHFFADAGGSAALTADFVEPLVLHPWTLNVRELQNVAQRIAIEAEAGHVGTELGADEAERFLPPTPGSGPLTNDADARDDDETTPDVRSNAPSREEIDDALRRADGNLPTAAKLLGTRRQQLYRWLRYHGIKPAK